MLTAAYAVSGSNRPGSIDEHLHEIGHARRRDVRPVQPAIRGRRDHAVVGADPDPVDVPVRGTDRVDDLRADRRRASGDCTRDAYVPTLFGTAHVSRVRSGLICFQLMPPSMRLPQHVVAVEERARIDLREDDRLRADGPIRRAAGRAAAAPPATGPTFDTCPVRRS